MESKSRLLLADVQLKCTSVSHLLVVKSELIKPRVRFRIIFFQIGEKFMISLMVEQTHGVEHACFNIIRNEMRACIQTLMRLPTETWL